jgi:hypothetical protein
VCRRAADRQAAAQDLVSETTAKISSLGVASRCYEWDGALLASHTPARFTTPRPGRAGALADATFSVGLRHRSPTEDLHLTCRQIPEPVRSETDRAFHEEGRTHFGDPEFAIRGRSGIHSQINSTLSALDIPGRSPWSGGCFRAR